MEELLPCPFCGESPKLLEAPNHADCIVYWVKCRNYKCELSVSAHQTGSPKAAAKLWNKRSPNLAALDELIALIEKEGVSDDTSFESLIKVQDGAYEIRSKYAAELTNPKQLSKE